MGCYASIGVDLYELWEARNRKTSFVAALIALNEALQLAYRVYEMLGGFNAEAKEEFLALHGKLQILVTFAEEHHKKKLEKKREEDPPVD